MFRLINTLLVAVALGLPLTLTAATLVDSKADKKGTHYTMYVNAIIEADADVVMRLLGDYEKLVDINPYLLESKLLTSVHEEIQQVSMLTRACILIFCYKLRQVQNFSRPQHNTIYAEFIPALSDFSYGWTKWTAVTVKRPAAANATLFIMEMEIEPDFFILPIIGPDLLKKKLIEIASVTINNLEAAAQAASR